MKDDNIRKQWEQFKEEYKEYIIENDQAWEYKLEQVKKYMDENNKKPSTTDKDKEIKTLGTWIYA